MWNTLPSDLLANIFSYLPPHSLARAMAACRHWHDCGRSATGNTSRQHLPWFLALPTRSSKLCFVHNPIESTWHMLNLEHVPSLNRPVSTVGGRGLILFKSTGSMPVRLSVCNPFTGQFRHLPSLRKPRTSPAIGVVEGGGNTSQYKVYVAGGMSEAASSGAASYEPTIEIFDSGGDNWTVMGSMPVEFAVRLTVWTPNESVYSSGVLYWMTSARAYSIMGFEIGTNKWKELGVPMGDTLEFAALVPREGKLAVVGGTYGGSVTIWELGEGDEWNVIERMPDELSKRLVGGSTKCVGIEGGVCLYKEIGSVMVVWRIEEDHHHHHHHHHHNNNNNHNNTNKWEWCIIEGCNQVTGRRLENWPIKGLFLHPNLVTS